MPSQQVLELGRGGVNTDTPPILLPMNVFSNVQNVRFTDEGVEAIEGEIIYRNAVNLTPAYGIHWQRPDQGYNVLLNNGVAARMTATGAESLMLNSADPQYANSFWDICKFNGGYAIVINNGKSTPLYALFGDPIAGNTFTPLPGWNYISGLVVTAKVVRSLGYSLVAANLTLTQGSITTYAPSTIRVSVQAATGQIPNIWQPGLTTDTADEFEINSTSPILDMAELRGNMYIYSDDNIHVLSISGGNSRLQPYAKGYGILNTRCVAEFDGNHLVVDRNDIYTHNGSGRIESLVNYRVRKYFFRNLNQAQASKVFVQRNGKKDEIWVCYPKGTAVDCSEAMIFNYRNNTWTFRQLPLISTMFEGPYPDPTGFIYADETQYMLNRTATMLIADRGYEMYDGVKLQPSVSFLEKVRMNSGDQSTSFSLNSIYPVFDQVPADEPIEITVTGQNNYTAVADFSNTSGRDRTVFLPNEPRNQGYKVDPRVKGRLLNLRIETTDKWRLALFGIDMSPADGR